MLEVTDHGPGVPPEVGNRVFERFFRGDPARVRDGAGAGLGLSIVAAVVASHHGRAWVEPVPGGGARFRVELPGRDVLLARHGDYVVFHGIGHSWLAEEESVVISVRWPSIPGYAIPGSGAADDRA